MPQPMSRFDYSENKIRIFFCCRGDEVSGKIVYFFIVGALVRLLPRMRFTHADQFSVTLCKCYFLSLASWVRKL